MDPAVNRRRIAAAVALSALVAAAACSFPKVSFAPPDDGGADATLSDGPGDGGSMTIDPDAPCPDDKKRCGIACASVSDPGHGCGAPAPMCDPCPGPPHTKSLCDFPDASCVYTCDDKWTDCDKDASNGCEVDTKSGDGQNCGGCNTTCDGGVCMLSGTCGASCGDAGTYCPPSTCADIDKDPRNCGGCGKTCDAGSYQTPSCEGRTCQYKCNDGFDDCDTQHDNGCEANLGSVATCGSCTNACDGGAHTGASCDTSQNPAKCLYACIGPNANCNGTLDDGCECPGGTKCQGESCAANSECCGGKTCKTASLLPCALGLVCTCQ